MHKVYLLLRNNKQTGPYSLDELLQQGLKPYDLVWEEGKSAAWRYPGELESLKLFAPAAPETATVANISSEDSSSAHEHYLPKETKAQEPVQRPIANGAAGKHIFVSMPGAVQARPKPVQEQKEQKIIQEETRYQPTFESSTPSQSGSIPSSKASDPQLTEQRFARTLNDVEEDYTSWVVNQNKKKNTVKKRRQLALTGSALITCAVIFFILRGLLAGSKPSADANMVSMNNATPATPSNTQEEADKNISAEENTANGIQNDKPEELENHTTSPVQTIEHTGESTNPDLPVANVPKRSDHEVQQSTKKKIIEAKPVINTPVIKEEQKNKIPAGPNTTASIDKTPSKTKQVQEPDIQSAPAAEVRQGSGRTAARRDTYSPDNTASHESSSMAKAEPVTDKPSVITISPDDVQITDNHSDDWMMGISGLKVTIRNTAPVALKTAAVEVLYFDENNRLLDKKSLVFNNIQPRSRVTLPAPDQKWADHVEYRLRQLTAGN